MNKHKIYILLFLIFISLSFKIEKPIPDGTYYQNTWLGVGDMITFKANRFERSESECLGRIQSKGTYSFDHNNLVLFYEKYPKPADYVEYNVSEKESLDSLIDIKIINKDRKNKEPIPFSNVVFFNNQEAQLKVKSANIEGELVTSFNRKDALAKIRVSEVGYRSFQLPFQPKNKDYEITIFLANGFNEYKETESDTLWDIKQTTNGFYFKYLKDDSTTCVMIKCPGHKLCK